MLLKNKENGFVYCISSEEAADCIRIFAVPCNPSEAKPFVMYYKSLEELNNDWEDTDAI